MNRLLKNCLLAVFILAQGFQLSARIQGGHPERELDRIAANAGGIRLVIFNPEKFNIQALEALRKNKIIDLPNLAVVGVYHEKQTGDFAAARKYVADNKLDWFKFHVIAAELDETTVYGTNACSREFDAIVKKADGVIFFGGPDIPPSVYHKETSLLTLIQDPSRHFIELSAVFHMLGGSQNSAWRPLLAGRPRFPVLGICLGFQTLNVGTGGTLIQDIWTELYGKTTVEGAIALGPEMWHSNPYRHLYPLETVMGCNFHSLELIAGSKFCTLMGFSISDHPLVRSSHHQAAGILGQGWVAAATSRDGKVIEAIEHRTYPNVLGIQFHPEHPQLWDPTPSVRLNPGEPLTSCNAILTAKEPSLPFNKAIWNWFSARLKESRGER